MSTSWTPTTAKPRRPGSPPGPSVEPRVLRDVADAILPPPSPADMRICRVSARDTTARTISVELGGDADNPVPGVRIANTSYYPRINDLAVIIQQESDLYAIGAVNAKVGKCQISSTAQRTTTNGAAQIAFDFSGGSVDFDTDSMASIAGDRININWPGTYVVGTSIANEGASAGGCRRVADIEKNGTFNSANSIVRRELFLGFTDRHVLAASCELVAGDFIQIGIYGGDSGEPNVLWGRGDGLYPVKLWATWYGPI